MLTEKHLLALLEDTPVGSAIHGRIRGYIARDFQTTKK
jgi:hypothetical protein